MPVESIFFHPLITEKSGSGHFYRSIECARELEGGRIKGIIIIDSTEIGETSLPEDSAEFPLWRINTAEPFQLTEPSASERQRNSRSPGASLTHGFNTALVVFDRKCSQKAHLIPWVNAGGTPLLLDDDGPARQSAPYLLDIIPGPRRSEANMKSFALLHLPARCREPDANEAKILVSLGGSDPAGLTQPIIFSLVRHAHINPQRIFLTLPSSADQQNLPSGVSVLKKTSGLKNQLVDYGLVICSYGITMWEAISAGCAVLTANPTRYHQRLTRLAHIPGIGTASTREVGGQRLLSSASEYRLTRWIRHARKLENAARALSIRLRANASIKEQGTASSLGALLSGMEAPKPVCAACGALLPPVIARFPQRSYYRCTQCGISGLYHFKLEARQYGPSYFQSEYRQQYGRSYLEDFEHIRAMAIPRLAAISNGHERRAHPRANLLDIGCAFGPFLQAAEEEGYKAHGIDVSAEAIDYVQAVLKIPAAAGSFPDFDPAAYFGLRGFDVISLWYVIEHFPDLKTVITRLNHLLQPGGILALSTPNSRGISGRRSLRAYLEHSPSDHYTIWNPRVAKRLLSQFGFRVYCIRITGHHPERFGVKTKPTSSAFLYKVLKRFSQLFGLGDSFELYAIKERSL